MKCATSTLHEQLARRQRFFMSEPKEPNFFNLEFHNRELADYQRLFAGAREDQIVGESSTHYTKLPTYQGTVDRIHQHTPCARFVYLMRDPIERMVSHYVHQWTEGQVDRSISDAVTSLPEYVAYSSYARQLEPYVERFGTDHILCVFFEHLVEDGEAELERVSRFLGDTSNEPFVWQNDVARTNVSKERLRKSRLREAVLSFALARKIKDALPSNLKERIKSVWRMEKRPELSQEAQALVTRVLDRDLATLGQWFGLELSCRNFAEVARRTTPSWVLYQSGKQAQ